MSTKNKTKTQTVNTLPEWLTSPYQAATQQASSLAQQPAIGTGTQAAIDRTMSDGANISNIAGGAAGSLSSLAGGNFGANSSALTGAANGQFLQSNPFAQNGQPAAVSGALNGFASGGNRATVSGALDGFRQNGALDTGYIDQSGLNRTAAGDYLSADSNPYIRGVAQRGADTAQAAINGQFGSAGRSNGSGLYAQLFGQGIADATNDVYAQNYANERQLQQGAQGTLLSSQAAAREAALSRQYSANGAVFGAENAGAESALGRQYGAASSLFGAQNASTENAAGRQAQAYESERGRQQSAAGGLLDTQLSAYGQLPGLLSSISAGNNAALAAGTYGDQAGLNQAGRYQSVLSGLSAPFAQQSGTQTQTTSGLGNALGTIAQLGGAAASMFSPAGALGAIGGGSGILSGLTGASSLMNLPANVAFQPGAAGQIPLMSSRWQ